MEVDRDGERTIVSSGYSNCTWNKLSEVKNFQSLLVDRYSIPNIKNSITEIKKSGVLKDKKSLLVQGSLSDNSLLNSLNSFSNTQKGVFYKTELIEKKYSELEEIIHNNKPYIIFTSPSSFDAFNSFYDAKKVKIVSIGNTTSSHINEKGFVTALTSGMQSYEGISESLIAFLKENTEYELSKN